MSQVACVCWCGIIQWPAASACAVLYMVSLAMTYNLIALNHSGLRVRELVFYICVLACLECNATGNMSLGCQTYVAAMMDGLRRLGRSRKMRAISHTIWSANRELQLVRMNVGASKRLQCYTMGNSKCFISRVR